MRLRTFRFRGNLEYFEDHVTASLRATITLPGKRLLIVQ